MPRTPTRSGGQVAVTEPSSLFSVDATDRILRRTQCRRRLARGGVTHITLLY
jgi:hypothetical protein